MDVKPRRHGENGDVLCMLSPLDQGAVLQVLLDADINCEGAVKWK